MSEIREIRQLRQWLAKHDADTRIAITARAVLRTVPALVMLKFRGGVRPNAETHILPAFRAMTAPWTAARFSNKAPALQIAAEAGATSLGFANTRDYTATFAVESSADVLSAIQSASWFASYATARPDDIAAAVDAISQAIIAIEETGLNLAASLTSVFTTRADTAAAAARQSAFRALNDDIRAINQNAPLRILTNSALWPRGMPEWVSIGWQELRKDLLESNQGWEVWTNWYDDRLKGSNANDELELARATIPDEVWRQPPEAVNAYIHGLVTKYNTNDEENGHQYAVDGAIVPELDAASLEPVWEDGILKIPEGSTPADLDETKFIAALRGLRAELINFSDDLADEANIDKRFVAFVQRVASRIPDTVPPQHELFRLGHDEEVFAGYREAVEEQWPEFLSSRYRALAQQFNLTIRQAPLWRQFKQNAAKQRLSSEQIDAAGSLALEIAHSLREQSEDGFVSVDLINALKELAAPLRSNSADQKIGEVPTNTPEVDRELVAIDVIESINNTLKRIAEAAIAIKDQSRSSLHQVGTVFTGAGADYAGGLGTGFRIAAKKYGKMDGERAFKWLRRAVVTSVAGTGASFSLSHLIATYPGAFAWLEGVLKLLF